MKQSQIITYQSKSIESLNILDIKSVIREHPKNSHKLCEIIMEAEKVGAGTPLYSEIKHLKIFGGKKCKNNKMISCF